jgi:hypothetical protein
MASRARLGLPNSLLGDRGGFAFCQYGILSFWTRVLASAPRNDDPFLANFTAVRPQRTLGKVSVEVGLTADLVGAAR